MLVLFQHNEAKANDPELQALNIQAQNLWSQFLPLFNEGQTFPPYSRDADTRDSTLAKKFVNDANDISKQSKAFRKKCPDGLKWIDPVAGPPLGEQIYAQLKTLNDSMISARRKCVKKLKNDSNKKIRKDYIGGSVQASWTEIQVAGQAVKAQDNIATSIVDQVNTVSAGQDDTLDNDTVDEDELADFDDKTSSVRKGLQALLNFNGIQSAYKALDGMRTERAPEHDSDIVIEDRFDMRMRESVEKEIVCKHLPEIAALPIDDVQRQFVVYLVTPWLREKMLKSAKIQETGQYKCQWCPIVPWHPINPPIFNREHRGKLKRHIFKEHNPWKELERLIEYQPDKFHCPSLDFEGPSSDKVREHMLKDCKDREQYQKLAADAKVEPDDADVEWESSVEVEEGDDLNLSQDSWSRGEHGIGS
ncbi:hypothetical protein MPER_12683 [Moniliophthora perniciosa FA553]|nr:hypothetical protein MPER_12683 [Moniliophthora perniciosa FA553]